MAMGIVGRKCGITQIFTEEGRFLPITLIEALPNRVTQIKTPDKEGYYAVQLTVGRYSIFCLSKPEAGHFAKAGVEAGRGLWEFRLDEKDDAFASSIALGQEFTVELFKPGQWVDVTGTSKGKGFSGVIKRHHFSTQDATHGNSLSHRAPGSIGQRQSPGRVFKGKKMAGQLGNRRCTIQSLQVMKTELEKNLLWIKGAVPGHVNGFVILKPSVKRSKKN